MVYGKVKRNLIATKIEFETFPFRKIQQQQCDDRALTSLMNSIPYETKECRMRKDELLLMCCCILKNVQQEAEQEEKLKMKLKRFSF